MWKTTGGVDVLFFQDLEHLKTYPLEMNDVFFCWAMCEIGTLTLENG